MYKKLVLFLLFMGISVSYAADSLNSEIALDGEILIRQEIGVFFDRIISCIGVNDSVYRVPVYLFIVITITKEENGRIKRTKTFYQRADTRGVPAN